jgi:hypothetical protein
MWLNGAFGWLCVRDKGGGGSSRIGLWDRPKLGLDWVVDGWRDECLGAVRARQRAPMQSGKATASIATGTQACCCRGYGGRHFGSGRELLSPLRRAM